MTLLSSRRFDVLVSIRLAARSLTSAGALLFLTVACREIVAPEGVRAVSETASLINPAGRVVIHASDMKSWVFYNDQNGTACSGSNCKLVDGPAGQPAGSGSAELAVAATTEGRALILPDYNGIRFDRLTSLRYSTYRQTSDAGNNLAISLQFNVDYDLGDVTTSYQGRIVFEPYMGVGGNVPTGTWQSWDTKVGRWWGTRTTVKVNNATVQNRCVQSTPCTWTQLLAAFPRLGVHNVYGALVLKAGSGWTNFRGNIDNLTVGVDSVETTFDFDLDAPAVVPAEAPNTKPWDLLDPSRILHDPDSLGFAVLADLIEVEFVEGTLLSERENAIFSVNGTVVGGFDTGDVEDTYLVLLPADTTGRTMRDAVIALSARSSVAFAMEEIAGTNEVAYRRPQEGAGLTRTDWILSPNDAFAAAFLPWAASAVGAPHAWGCTEGEGALIQVIDMGLASNPELAGRIHPASVLRPAEANAPLSHGQRMAGIAAATSGNGIGIAGIAPRAQLLLSDVGSLNATTMRLAPDASGFPEDDLGFLREAWVAGRRADVPIINISLGGNTAPNPELTERRRRLVHRLRLMLDSFPAWDPLLVIAAGNGGPSGRHDWSLFGILRDTLPTRTLIVGAARREKNLAGLYTNAAGTVDIYAPGDSVAVFDAVTNAAVLGPFGTSNSTAFVSGAAALLLSFDPSLTAAQLRALLLDGADPSRAVDGKPFLDAYGSVRRASGKNGAPLCGVRSWGNDAGDLVVQRLAGTQTIIPSGGDPWASTYINIHHGGKRIERSFSDRYVWNSTGWNSSDWGADTTGDYSASFKSSGAWFQDHDDDVSSQVVRTLVPGGVKIDVTLTPTVSGSPIQVPSAIVSVSLMAAVDTMCAREALDSTSGPTQYLCSARADTGQRVILRDMDVYGTDPNALHALDPQSNFVVVPLVTRRRHYQLNPTWVPCSGPDASKFPAIRCRGGLFDSTATVATSVVRVDRATGALTEWQLPASGGTVPFEPFWLAIADDSRELILQVAGYRLNAGTVACENPRHLWLTMPSSPGTLSSAFVVPLSTNAMCDGSTDGSASIRMQSDGFLNNR